MIPRPPAVEPGGPAPWSSAAALSGLGVASVLQALAHAGLRLPRCPVPAPVPGGAAVLVALFEEDGEAHVVLTRRASALRNHGDQISFPGGRIDPGEDALSAAVREAFEEIALDPALVRPAGVLEQAAAFSSGRPITPVVATLATRPALAANPAEVARVFDVSLADLAGAFTEERWTVPGRGTFPMYFFEVATETVWGATARMLVDLLTLVLVGRDA